MRPRQLTHLILVLLLGMSLSWPALAQTPTALLNKGNQLFAKAEYEAAFEAFKAGYDKKKDPVFLRSMAFCQLKLYHHEKAREYLKEYLTRFKTAPDLSKLKELDASLEVVVQTRVKISSTPPGASIYIDAEVAGKVGTTPKEGSKELTIEPGKHLLILKANKYHPTTQSFEIKAKETLPLAVTLEVPLRVGSSPDGGSVHIDSADAPSLGNTPLDTGVTPGKHTVYVKKSGYKSGEQTVNAVVGNNEVNVKLNLGINVAVRPDGAAVELDGKEVGKTPMEIVAEAGPHTVTIKSDPCQPLTQKVDVQPGGSNQVTGRLTGCGLLSMRTDVQGAAVKVGSLAVGETPLTEATVPSGKQQVALTHPDRREWSGALDFSDIEVVNAEVRMGRNTWPLWVVGGLTVAALTVGIVGTAGAMGRSEKFGDKTFGPNADEYEYRRHKIDSDDNGELDKWVCDQWTAEGWESTGCGSALKYHHMATTGWFLAGTTAATGLLYYLFWVRPKVEIQRQPIGDKSTASAPRPTM